MFGTDATGSRVRRRLQVLVLAPLALTLVACSDGSGGSPGTQIRPTAAAFSGSGDKSTPEFRVAPGWEIQWTTEGERFQVTATGAQDLGTLVSRTQPGGGSAFPKGAGKFRLQITAKGLWTITVINHSTK